MTPASGNPLDSLWSRPAEVTQLEDHDGRSGARLERVRLEDGTELVVKYSDPATDLTVSLAGGVQRERLLWESGVFAELPEGLGHPIVAIGEDAGVTVTVMRDLGDAIPGWDRILTVDEADRVLDALSSLHATFLDRAPSIALDLRSRLELLSPRRFGASGGDHPLGPLIERGWLHFADLVDDDVVAAVNALHQDVTPLADVLGQAPQTLVHADLWPVNLALLPDQVVFLDWAIASRAPGVLDLAVFLSGAAAHVEPGREQLIEAFMARSPITDNRTLALALLAGLLDSGWNKALDVVEHPDAAVRERQAADLQWWLTAAEAGLAALG